jgi:UDP-N-acetylmuramyl tripeptide synthase
MKRLSLAQSVALAPIILFAKLLTALLKATRMGSGTALPGLLVSQYFPFVFKLLVLQIPHIIAVTGTNGKTTTQTMLTSILRQSPQFRILQNKAGANLSQGILSELLKQASPLGKLNFTHAVLEVEEATLPRIAKLLNPKLIAVTNLYRDQLDAYGEIDVTEHYIHQGIAQCPETLAVLNGDDPRTARLTKSLPNATYYVSLPATYACYLPYEGQTTRLDDLTENVLRAENIQIRDDLTTTFEAVGVINQTKIDHLPAQIASPGFFHVYNALTAMTIARLLGLSDQQLQTGLAQFQPAFGRGERLIKQEGSKRVTYRLLLVKNPASFSLNLNLLRHIPQLKLIIAINDNTADGKDVSWLWDSELECLDGVDIDWIMCTGVRAKDMKVRLKYALTDQTLISQILADENLQTVIDHSFQRAKDGDTLFVLPTYTAMLKYRKLMGKALE